VAYLLYIVALRCSQRVVRSHFSYHAVSDDVTNKTSGNRFSHLLL